MTGRYAFTCSQIPEMELQENANNVRKLPTFCRRHMEAMRESSLSYRRIYIIF
jgi:hypothetical protein